MNTIDIKAFEYAISQIDDGFLFENFSQCFMSSVIGHEFIPIGGTKDKGIDGLRYIYYRKDKETEIYQISTESDVNGKIRDTINKLSKNNISITKLRYVTNRKVDSIETISDGLSDELGLPIQIFDKKWFLSNCNHSQATINCYYTFIDSYLHEFRKPGKTVTISNLDSDPRIYVYLRQQLEDTNDISKIDTVIADGLILYALEGTDPDKDIFRNKEEIYEKVGELVKFSSNTLKELIDSRLDFLTTKPRSAKHHTKVDAYCLPYDTRLQIQERNLLDGKLAELFIEETSVILHKYLQEEGKRVKDISKLVNQTIHKIYYKQGLEFSNFIINGSNEDAIEKQLHDVVANVVDNSSVVEYNRTKVKSAIITTIRHIVYNGSENQIKYLKCLSNTYLTMFMLQWEPQIATYFQAMASDMNIFVDNSILIPALSEYYLAENNRRHWNLLLGAKKAGINLLINETILDELVAHFKKLRNKYYSLFQPLEEVYSDESETLYITEILLRSYYYAKISDQIKSYDDFINNFLDPDLKTAKDDLIEFLNSEFGISYRTNEQLGIKVDDSKYQRVVDYLKDHKQSDKNAENDAMMMLTIYRMRELFNEQTKGGIFGYKTWWLSKDTNTYKAIVQVLGETDYPISCYMRPDFIYNYIALSPHKHEIDEIYDKLFPSLLGVNISYHIDSELAEIVQTRMAEFADKKPSRIRAILRRLSEKIKSEPNIRNRKSLNHYLDEELEKLNE